MMVLPASRKTARSVTLTLDPLAAGLLNPLPRPRAIAVGLRKGGADARGVAGRDVVLLHQGVVDEVPVRVLDPDQRGHVAAAALAGPRLDQPLVRLPHAAAGLPLVDLRIPRAARVDRPHELRGLDADLRDDVDVAALRLRLPRGERRQQPVADPALRLLFRLRRRLVLGAAGHVL